MDVQIQISDTSTRRCSCCEPLQEPVNSFFKSQWQSAEYSVIFLIYRWCFATWFAVTLGFSLYEFYFDGKWFIYFTNWGYLLCTLVAVYSVILVSIYACVTCPKAPCPRWMVKSYCFQLPEGISRIEIVRLYRYFFIGPDSHSCIAHFHNINSHAVNSVLMILDQMVVAFPTRIKHFIYPAFVVIIYIIFSIIYFLTGGENVIGKPYIYRILNWGEQPLSSSFVSLGGLLLVFPMCLLGYLIYKLRLCLCTSKYLV
ncbi:protein rolling stone-like isoform X2 [Ceratitis capitata]|uniref:protein rolling stone-like isoform X2 n=1 Tax=Ceratitis capitata TaxID=7213 RepID=UPI000A119BDB|nr:protein rolling stone-like isoform X2 [Ceratitis capitata]